MLSANSRRNPSIYGGETGGRSKRTTGDGAGGIYGAPLADNHTMSEMDDEAQVVMMHALGGQEDEHDGHPRVSNADVEQ
jgi:hypothetical protein